MKDNSADRNLLIGIIAMQMEFISRDQAVAAMFAWVGEKSKSLDEVLVQQGSLDKATQQVLVAVVNQRLSLHDGSATKGLATITTPIQLKQALGQIADRDVERSLLQTISSADLGTASRQVPITPGSKPVGRFRIIRPHAKGGLGEVHVAFDDELRREVALKEIQLEHASDLDCRARFLQEAEITGGLEHPGIVPVYGMGTYTDGRPFYAMRFIQGESLRDAIKKFHRARDSNLETAAKKKSTTDTEKQSPSPDLSSDSVSGFSTTQTNEVLTFRNLIGRFVDVCQAIDYAHSRGVVHRDIKPSNIMLGRFGETLIVDWGLAKPVGTKDIENKSEDKTLRPQTGSGSTPTQLGTAIGTPAYMSPEQAAGKHDKLTIASDVYSLGATLYCLLTGHPPFEDDDVGSILRRVISSEFEPPRKVVGNVPKPLESICLKAMSREPKARYTSARELADDLDRWLGDEPVSVYDEPLAQRARRFGKRHRAAVAGGIATIVVSFAALIFVAINVGLANQKLSTANREIVDQQKQLSQSNEQLTAARILAEQKQGEAEQKQAEAEATRDELEVVVNYLEGMFLAADPVGIGGINTTYTPKPRQELTARDILEMGEKQLASLDSTPNAKAALMTSIANSYRSLAFLDDAERLLDEALEIRREVLPPDHPEMAESLHQMGWVKHDQGEYDEAERLYREALRIRREAMGENSIETAESMFQLAWLLADISETDEAEELFRGVVDIRTELLGKDDRATGVAWGGLIACKLAGDFNNLTGEELNEVLAALKEAIRVFTLNEGDRNAGGALLAFQDAELQHRIFKNLERAEESYRKSLQLTSELMGPRHPWVALARHELGTLLIDQRRYEEAVSELRQAISICEEHLPTFHPKTGIAAGTLGKALERQGEFAEAEIAYVQSSQIFAELYRRLPDRESVWTQCVYGHHEVARIQFRQDKLDQALESAATALGVAKEFEQNPIESFYVLRLIAEIHEANQQPDAALDALTEAYTKSKQLKESDDEKLVNLREFAFCAYRLGQQLINMNRVEDALPFLRQDVETSEVLISRQPLNQQYQTDLRESEDLLCSGLLKANRHDEAEQVMTKQVSRLRSRLGGFTSTPAVTYHLAVGLKSLAVVCEAKADNETAIGHLEEAKQLLESIKDDYQPNAVQKRLDEIDSFVERLSASD